MEKSVLLVLFLQVFLLITAFTFADAAALVTDPQQPPDLVERRNDRNREIFGNRRKRQSHCSWRPGACGALGMLLPPSPPPRPPSPPPRPSLEVLLKQLKERDGQRATFGEGILEYY